MIQLPGAGGAFPVVALVLATATVAAVESPQSFLAGVDSRDAAALLRAGIKLEEEGRASWALRCYRRVLQLEESPARPDAMFRAARIEIARGNYEEGYELLHDAAEKEGHAGARAVLEKAATRETKNQRDLLERARKSMEKGNAETARPLFSDAYKLFPGTPVNAPFATRRQVLLEMAKCVDSIDDAHWKSKVQPLQGKVVKCSKCGSTGGFISCEPCKGLGKIPTTVQFGRQKKTVDLPCAACRIIPEAPGTGWVFCPPPCYGLQAYPGSRKLGDRERKAVLDVLDKVRSVKTLSGPLASVLDTVENTLLQVRDSASLDYLRSIEPRYSFSREIRDRLGDVPPGEKALAAAAGAWKTAGRDVRIRANFLFSYALEFARWLKPFEMLRAPKKKVDFQSPPVASAMAAAAVAPEILSAEPEDMMSGWLAVDGVFEGYKVEGTDATKGLLEVRGSVPHNVRFFIWLPAAEAGIRWLEKGFWYPRLGGLTKSYPFDIHTRASAIPRGHRVVVAGRFLRDRLGFPRNWFEVWDFRVGLGREAEEVFLALREPVTEMDFRGVKASELAGFLEVLHGIKVEWGSIDGNARLDVSARDCPVGLAVDAVAKAFDASWHFKDGTVVLGRQPPRGDMAPVIEELAALDRGSIRASRSDAAVASRPTRELPDSPAALEKMALDAMRRMDYGLALECRDRLLGGAAEGEEQARLARDREKVRLFHELTRHTPVSSLVGAKEVVRLGIRNRAGDTSVQTVRILERTPDLLRFQPSYGGAIGVKADQVVKETRIAGGEWRTAKRRELSERLAKAGGAGVREQASEHFLLALFAKTNGFPDEGTALLEKAIASDEFGRLVATYFPAASRDLSSAWRKATGRDVKAAPPVEPATAATPVPGAKSGVRADEPFPAAPTELAAFAKKHLDQGRACLARSLPGMEGAKEMILLARQHLEKARDALDKLPPERAADPALKLLRQDVSQGLQDCVKCLGFFD
jgi:tetratricopeptide (TPR) repeat protein